MKHEADILAASILIVDDQEANVRCWSSCWPMPATRMSARPMNPQEVCALHRKNATT
jgi:hypothetical protein